MYIVHKSVSKLVKFSSFPCGFLEFTRVFKWFSSSVQDPQILYTLETLGNELLFGCVNFHNTCTANMLPQHW